MRKTIIALIIINILLPLITIRSVADTRIMSQNIDYCESGEAIFEEVRQGERVEISIRVLVSEEKELSLFSELNDVSFYLEEEKISSNSSVNVILPPGTHNFRVIGSVHDIAEDGEQITLLGSYSLGRYITAKISSPFILKNTAYSYAIVSGFLGAIFAALVVFFFTKGKLYNMRSTIVKKSEEQRKKARDSVIGFVKGVAGSLNADQRREAKELLRKLDEV